MKRFSKMLALGMAAALVFGMTVSAAGSKTTADAVAEGTNAVIKDAGVQDSEGKAIENPPTVSATVLPENVYNEKFGTNYQAALEKADDDVEAIFASENKTITIQDSNIIDVEVKGEIPENGLYVPVMPYAEGVTYVVAHWNGTAWEKLQTKNENEAVYALFPKGFSPVYVATLTVTGDDNQPSGGGNGGNNNNNSNDNNSSNSSTEPASPKTGETLPVAGILAVICLAAAAVCAKKVRYNR